MTKLNISILTLSLFALLSCNPVKNGQDQTASAEIGVPVLVWAGPQDFCGQEQYKKFWSEYQAATDEEKSEIRKKVSVYDAVIFEGSKSPTVLHQVKLRLIAANLTLEKLMSEDQAQLGAQDSNASSDNQSDFSIQDHRLLISPSSLRPHLTLKIYQTSDPTIFDSIKQEIWPVFRPPSEPEV